MAPTKKNKKDANSINSKLALVMKSGKGTFTIYELWSWG
jgi:large subunit ribosomal protein L30e